jgi:hypothetical protein
MLLLTKLFKWCRSIRGGGMEGRKTFTLSHSGCFEVSKSTCWSSHRLAQFWIFTRTPESSNQLGVFVTSSYSDIASLIGARIIVKNDLAVRILPKIQLVSAFDADRGLIHRATVSWKVLHLPDKDTARMRRMPFTPLLWN